MYNEPTGGWIMALLATLLALWTYKLSKQSEIVQEKEFKSTQFLGQKYWCLYHDEPYFMMCLKKLIKTVKWLYRRTWTPKTEILGHFGKGYF